MTDSKISQLISYSTPNTSSDTIAIVDSANSVTKKILPNAFALLTATKIIAPSSSGVAADYYTTGSADDVQIQAAINAVNTAGGGTVFLRAGTYTISSTIAMKSNVWLTGEGFITIVKLANSTNVDVFSVGAINTFRMSNFLIDGNKTNQTLAHYGIIAAGSANNFIIDQVWVQNTTSDGIRLIAANNFKIYDSYAFQCGTISLVGQGNGGFDVANSNDFILRNCKADTCAEEGINIYNSYDFSILDCKGINSTVEHGLHTNLCYQYDITGGEYNNNVLSGIKAIDSYRYVINGTVNIGNTGAYGIWACSNGNPVYEIVVVNNVAKGNLRGIYTSNNGNSTQNDTIVANNTVVGNTQAGIELSVVNNTIVTGNLCKNNQYGIFLSGTCVNNVVSNNRCYDDQGVQTQVYGIYESAAASSGNTYIGNNVSGNLTAGMNLLGSAQEIGHNIGY